MAVVYHLDGCRVLGVGCWVLGVGGWGAPVGADDWWTVAVYHGATLVEGVGLVAPLVLRVYGYHGTNREAADRIRRSGFRPSRNPWDWLGDGVYFWQDAPNRAWDWAIERHGADAAVVAAEIRLERCLDLLDSPAARSLRLAYAELERRSLATRTPLPRQRGGRHELDRSVVNLLARRLRSVNEPIDVVRAGFLEGEPMYPGSAFWTLSHVQIAVRNLALIEWVSVHQREETNRPT